MNHRVTVRRGAAGVFEVPCDSDGSLVVARVGDELQLVHRRSGLALHHVLSRSFLPSYYYTCPADDATRHFLQRCRFRIANLATWNDEIPIPTRGLMAVPAPIREPWDRCIALLLQDMRSAGDREGSSTIMNQIDRKEAQDLRSKIWRSTKICGCSTTDELVDQQVRKKFWWQAGSWWSATKIEIAAKLTRMNAESVASLAADLRSLPADPRKQ